MAKNNSYKRAARAAKRKPVLFAAAAVILVIIVAAVAVFWYFKPEFFHRHFGFGEHSFGEWETVEEADCTADGLKLRSCTMCGEPDEEVIPATGHGWEEEWTVTKEATCADGVRERGCTRCSEIQTEAVPAVKEHIYGEWREIVAATCGDGKRERLCSVCGGADIEITAGTGNHNFGADNICIICKYDNSSSEGTEAETRSAELSVHFLELGNKYTGDCTLIKYGDTEILIDAGSRQNSAVTIKNYIDKYCADGVLEYVIATHAHQDHIAGFVGTKSGNSRTGILYQYEVGTLIQFAGHNTSSQIYQNYCAAVTYAGERGADVYTARQCWYETDGAKKSYPLDADGKVTLNILYQRYYDEATSDENDYSVCVLLTQETDSGVNNYLFTGDLEEKGEASLAERNSLPQVKLFKGGHHGSYTASTEKLLKEIKPENVAVCCCCGSTEYTANKDNTFPSQKFIDRVGKYTENIYCTTLVPDYKGGAVYSMNGNIVFYTLGGKFKLWCSNGNTILKETDWFKENRTWNGI